MLLESLVKATVELQGFRVVTVTGRRGRIGGRAGPRPPLRAPMRPVWDAGRVPRHPSSTALPPCTAVGDPGGAALRAAPRGVPAMRRRACRVDALGAWEAADDARTAGDAGDVGPRVALGAGRAVVPVLVGHRGHGRRGGGRLRPGAPGPRPSDPHRH